MNVARGDVNPDEATMLREWNEDGYTVLRGAIPHPLIDALWRDADTAWSERPACKILTEGVGVTMLADSPPKEQLTHHHYRVMDFHNLSQAGAEIMMHPLVLRTLELIFGEPVIAMQSLLFEYGSEQGLHQDFPYVHAEIPSHLIGVWVACEEANAENGSLMVYPGSHRVPLFDFGNGSVLARSDDRRGIEAYEAYLDATCKDYPRAPEIFRAQKGDVILWHGALIHCGAPALNHALTRRTFVSHYSTQRGYTRDRRSYNDPAVTVSRNGGTYHAWQFPGHREGRYQL